MDRFDELSRRYTERIDGVTDPEARRIYPRYHVVAAILEQVERLDPDDLPDTELLTRVLVTAADVEPSPPAGDDVDVQAVRHERELFRSQVRALRSRPELKVAPLGYRRVLTAAESSVWRASLRRWGVEGGTWHPMLAGPIPPDVLVLADAAMMHAAGVDALRDVLRDMGRQRVVELREYGADYLLDVAMFSAQYTGAEGFWTDARQDWVAYASHENTVAFGGTLADALAKHWPDVDRWRWQDWNPLSR